MSSVSKYAFWRHVDVTPSTVHVLNFFPCSKFHSLKQITPLKSASPRELLGIVTESVLVVLSIFRDSLAMPLAFGLLG